MINILIADDHEIVRQGLKSALLDEFSFANIEEAGDATELIGKAVSAKWDIVISDLSMPGGGGMAALKKIRETLPALPVLILSIYPEEQYALRLKNAGASGYLNKDAAGDELIKAVHKILAGKNYFSQYILEKSQIADSRKGLALHESLSDREMEVFKLIANGNSISDIAAEMSVNASTISTYRTRILDKMNMKSNAELSLYATEFKII